jgi:hypothetical protein
VSTLYALYRGDEFVDVGTANELAERRGVMADSIRYLASAAYRRRQHVDECVYAYNVGNTDEDETTGKD